MRLLLAISHREIQMYLAKDRRVEIITSVESKEELFEILSYTKADVLLLSRQLKGSSNDKETIEQVIMLKKNLKIIYLYGDEDSNAKEFIKCLEKNGIYDYFVGTSISSVELNNMLFGVRKRNNSIFRDLIKINYKSLNVKDLYSSVITVFSNSSNGKSHFAWNLASALSYRGYKVTLINADRGYSANLYFGIDDVYYDLLNYLSSEVSFSSIMDNCYTTENISVISGRLGDENTLKTEDFLKLLYFARAKSDIVIIDTYTGLNETTLQAINTSSIDFMIFDSDLMHFHMNKLMLDKLGDDFIANKTIAVINNSNTMSQGYKYIYKQINRLSKGFKAVLPLRSCGSLGCDLMHTGKTPYIEGKNSNNRFYMDMDMILQSINAKDDKVSLSYEK